MGVSTFGGSRPAALKHKKKVLVRGTLHKRGGRWGWDGRSGERQDLALEGVDYGVAQTDAQNTAVDDGATHPTRKCGTRPGMAKPGGRRMPKHRCARLGGMVLQDLGDI